MIFSWWFSSQNWHFYSVLLFIRYFWQYWFGKSRNYFSFLMKNACEYSMSPMTLLFHLIWLIKAAFGFRSKKNLCCFYFCWDTDSILSLPCANPLVPPLFSKHYQMASGLHKLYQTSANSFHLPVSSLRLPLILLVAFPAFSHPLFIIRFLFIKHFFTIWFLVKIEPKYQLSCPTLLLSFPASYIL